MFTFCSLQLAESKIGITASSIYFYLFSRFLRSKNTLSFISVLEEGPTLSTKKADFYTLSWIIHCATEILNFIPSIILVDFSAVKNLFTKRHPTVSRRFKTVADNKDYKQTDSRATGLAFLLQMLLMIFVIYFNDILC